MDIIKSRLIWLIEPYRGSNRISRWLRGKIEPRGLSELIGIPLAVLMFFGAFVMPQVQAGLDSSAVRLDTRHTAISAVVTDAQYRWPLNTFGISQNFSGRHRGMDLTNPAGTPVYPVADGTVTAVFSMFSGYGKHVIITHDGTVSSLYAHLAGIDVTVGQAVTKDTVVGSVGSTGWATGNHLHLEIYQNGVAANPLEILPEIKRNLSQDSPLVIAPEPKPKLSL